MTDTTTSPAPAGTAVPSAARTTGRWLLTFAGFPLGGLLTDLVVGPVDGAGPALAGGLLTGAVLGAVQAWGLRGRVPARRWVAGTAAGLAVGLVAGGAVTDHGTTAADLVLLGAACGAAVGTLQALVLLPRLGRAALAWPALLAAVWAAGWAVTTAVGVRVEEQFSVFGSSGAVVVTALTAVLPLLLGRTDRASAGSAS